MPKPYSLTPVNPHEAGRLFVLAFADELSAFSLRETLCQMEEERVIEVGDAVVATRNAQGKVRLHQSLPLVAAGSLLGSFSGMLLGMLLLNPLFGIRRRRRGGRRGDGGVRRCWDRRCVYEKPRRDADPRQFRALCPRPEIQAGASARTAQTLCWTLPDSPVQHAPRERGAAPLSFGRRGAPARHSNATTPIEAKP